MYNRNSLEGLYASVRILNLLQSVALDRFRRVLRKRHVASNSCVKRRNRKGWNGFWSCSSFSTDLGMKVCGKSYYKEPEDLCCLPRVTLLPWMSFTSLWGLNVTKTSGEVDCQANPHYFLCVEIVCKWKLCCKQSNGCCFMCNVNFHSLLDAFGFLAE